MKKIFLTLKTILILAFTNSFVFAEISIPSPSTTVLNQIASSMSSSVTNDTQSIEDSGNATASLIDSVELSEGIKKAAEKNGLQITTEAAKYHWKAGKAVPMVVRGPTGAGTRSGPFHSISPESLLAHHPGIKVVAPSNPYDAKGLLVAAVNDPNPVMYLEHKKLYRKPDIKMEVPLGLYEVEIGKGKIVKKGSYLTIVTWSGMVSVATEAAKQLENDGIIVDIVDIRTIVPLDEEIILTSVEKTSNLCILQEDVPFSSVASEISSVVAEKGFWNLDNPIVKVTPPNTHIPFAPVLEDAFIPSVEKVVKAVKELQ